MCSATWWRKLEVVLMQIRSTSQHSDAAGLISLTESLGSFTQHNAALRWPHCSWALNWCPCVLRGNGFWRCSEQTGQRLRKHRLALCGQTLCSRFCRVLLPSVMTVKDLSGHDNSLCSAGREEEESYKKKVIFHSVSQKYMVCSLWLQTDVA